ncbi:MAG TPA: ParA family protein [Candidatus Dormibacteraeota bacterium]|nr:ParA family protein [Candidatus Dormibacteraeota bacterium]
MTVTIAAISGKGGTGKTTTTINLACALAELDRRVLAVDMDPQANLTSGIGYDPYRLEETVFQALTGESPNGTAVISSEYGVDLLPSSPDLSAVESSLRSGINREYLLRDVLARLTAGGRYDYVLIDTPPNFGFHTLNALAAADYILVPVQMSGFAIKGLKEVLRTVAAARQRLNSDVRVLGILPTFVSPRTNFSRDMLEALHNLPSLPVFNTMVKHTVKLAETSLEGVPILRYASSSEAAKAYRDLAAEIVAAV